MTEFFMEIWESIMLYALTEKQRDRLGIIQSRKWRVKGYQAVLRVEQNVQLWCEIPG